MIQLFGVHGVVVAMLAIATPRLAHADVELWTELGGRYDVGRKITLTFDQHVRFDTDVSRVGAVMPEAGVSILTAPWLRLAAGYRLDYERDGDDEMVVRHRVYANARGRLDLGPLRAEHRLQLQDSIRPASMDVHRPVLRARLAVSYRSARPWVPTASVETFHRLHDLRFEKVWLTLGGARTGNREVEVFYRIELTPDEPLLSIVGLAFHAEP